jgi:4a-hydroxytetrahydrobiopterin dehydratase
MILGPVDREKPVIAKLAAQDRDTAIGRLQGWTAVDGRDAIQKTFKFKDFTQAFGFMAQTALVAERMNHHPEWRNVWNTVEVVLTTHEAKGVTQRDVDLAAQMDRIADQFRPRQ